ncbi:MAG: cytochrome c [Gammaproteobacteria bacterium]|nr:cytochrome c [Gammaproteobacteria bacterium]
MKKTIAMVAGAALLSLGVIGNAAADGAALYQAKGCAGCHGPDAKSPIMPIYPKIAGQSADYAFNQMKDIKTGARTNGQSMVMKGIVAGVSEAELKELATWLSGL